MTMPMSFSASAAAQSGSSNFSTLTPSVLTPLNFDNSGWVVQVKSTGDPSAQGSTGANGGGLNSTPTGATTTALPSNMLLIGGVLLLWLLMRNR